MPSAISTNGHRTPTQGTGVIKFTNCRLVKGDKLDEEDLWISSISGKIINGQEILYEHRTAPDQIIDLGGRILAPGFIDVQLNGAYGFDFSVIPEDGSVGYGKGVLRVNRSLVTTGVTSYLPTLTSQRPEVYEKALPFLGPSGSLRDPIQGSESLGAHCEGPFISPKQNGIHNISVLRTAPSGLPDLATCYGTSNLSPNSLSPIKLVTLAPELPGAVSCIQSLASLGVTVSIGHSDCSYEIARTAIQSGATMITHLFNAMKPLHHRNPNIFGLLGTSSPAIPSKPYFGIIADGIHLHPTSIQIAYHAHPSGLILVTDAMRLSGLPDGTYDWTNGSRIVKNGPLLTLEENGKIAGSSIQLVDCVTNFMNWTGASVAQAIGAVTETPARMLGMQDVKGSLREGADADLVVLELQDCGEGNDKKFVVDQVWKFGEKVFEKA